MKTFRHGGKMGDVIFSLPTIRELGGGILYLPERTPDGCSNLYSFMKSLLELQPYITEVKEYPSGLAYGELAPGINIDYDLDLARKQRMKGRVHIVKRYLDAFGVKLDNWKEPWLEPLCFGYEYDLFSWTPRYQNAVPLNWQPYVDKAKEPVFIGTHEEFVLAPYEIEYGLTITSCRSLAHFIFNSRALYCTQSLPLAIAQALGKEYYLERYKDKTNCHMGTKNEHLLP